MVVFPADSPSLASIYATVFPLLHEMNVRPHARAEQRQMNAIFPRGIAGEQTFGNSGEMLDIPDLPAQWLYRIFFNNRWPSA